MSPRPVRRAGDDSSLLISVGIYISELEVASRLVDTLEVPFVEYLSDLSTRERRAGHSEPGCGGRFRIGVLGVRPMVQFEGVGEGSRAP